MFTEHEKITWKKVGFAEASEQYSIDAISEDGLGEVFAEEPESYLVHEGDVVIDGPVAFGAADDEDVTMHVIDGNLTINGPLLFNQGDYYGALYVTGSITCENAFVGTDAMLYVGKSMHVEGLLVTNLTNPAHFAIKESLTAGHWLEAAGRGLFEIGEKPKARLLRVNQSSYHAFSDYAKKAEAEGKGKLDAKPFGFWAKDAVSVKGILHPSLLEGEEDIDERAIREAMEDGSPLFA